jgi:hypothetical protein
MIRYWAERFPPLVFVPAAVLIALAARPGDLPGLADVARALLLLGQFRLWDDLADRERDRHAHPERLLVRAGRATPFAIVCGMLGAINIAIAAYVDGLAAAVFLLLLNAAAAAWYTWRPARRTAAGDLTLLSKYPAFVMVLASGSSAPSSHVFLTAGLIYGCACAFEIWHDAAGPLRFTQS